MLLGLSDISMAGAQQRNFDIDRKQEMRQRRIEEFRAIRQIERLERLDRQNGKQPPQTAVGAADKVVLPPIRPASELSQRPLPKFNRLTPEERVALRRQIREARVEIYQKRQEKN